MKKFYLWKDLTDDGLLKDPPDIGPYCDKQNVNFDGPFSTEEDACHAFRLFKKHHKWGIQNTLVLVAFYSVSDEVEE